MKLFTPFILLIIVCLFGCLGSLQTGTQTTPVETVESEPLAVLQLSTSKTSYSAQEVVPLELSIQNGKFDLLVPMSTVLTHRAFNQLTVTDSNGTVVKIKRTLPPVNTLKTLYRDGTTARCVQGYDFKAGTTQTASLDNMQAYYQLPPGTYTVKATVLLEVYKESMGDQHPQEIELQREILDIQKNTSPQFTPEAKKEAIGYTQDQIDFIREKYKDELQNIYLPLKSRRGKASLESNTISITIE